MIYLAMAAGAILLVKKTYDFVEINRRDPGGANRIRAKAMDDLRTARLNEEAKIALRQQEKDRAEWRDSDRQDKPYPYRIGKHANEALAIRYGIANQIRKIKEYTYHAKGGELKRNPARDTTYFEPSSVIRLKKRERLRESVYAVELTDFRDRAAVAVIETGAEYVKTFLPLDEERWFKEQAGLEIVLKGNGTFSLKELARFHIEKAIK